MLLMFQILFSVTCFVLSEGKANNVNRQDVRKFPDEILFGSSTSSHQVEGAWDVDGKTENIWDHASHLQPCRVAECHTGDVAANSYNLYKRDVEMVRELGLDFYRFSLSWTRILPTSFPDEINEKGVEYYNNLINELLKYNIQPMVTLFHWDLPQKLQDLGGWANPLIVDWYTDFARVAFELFGDRVKYWFTINEPRQICDFGYGISALAPLLNDSGYGDYLCAKYVLLSHAKAYHMYNEEYRSKQGGTIGIALSASWHEPESEEHAEAAEDARQFEWGIYANPIFSKKGDFPEVMKQKVALKSMIQGFPRSRLPEFTPEEIEYVKGSSDFFGINHYVSVLVYRNESVYGYHREPSLYDDVGVVSYTVDSWEGYRTKLMNLPNVQQWTVIGLRLETRIVFPKKLAPWGFYNLLTKIREDYDNPPVIISENGCGSPAGLVDDVRTKYYRQYLDAVLDAIEEGSDIKAYTAWSLMDNFEWMDGYTVRFGLYEVDFDSPERTRTPRKSAYVFKEIARTHSLDHTYEPDLSLPLTIDEGH